MKSVFGYAHFKFMLLIIPTKEQNNHSFKLNKGVRGVYLDYKAKRHLM